MNKMNKMASFLWIFFASNRNILSTASASCVKASHVAVKRKKKKLESLLFMVLPQPHTDVLGVLCRDSSLVSIFALNLLHCDVKSRVASESSGVLL